MAKFPAYEEMSKKVAEKALDEFLYNGKSIREWIQIIASEDAISRQVVVDYLCTHCPDDAECFKDCDNIKNIKSLPPVTQQPKMGYWIAEIKSDSRGNMWPTNPKCSECGGELEYSNTVYSYKFCPYCGTKMGVKTKKI